MVANPLTLRLLSLAVTAALIVALSPYEGAARWTIYTWGLVHYTLALVYSKRLLRDATRTPDRAMALAGLVALALALYLGNVSLVIYFGLHHAFNEAYGRDDGTPNGSRAPTLQGMSFALQLAYYLATVRSGIGMEWANGAALWAAVAVTSAAYLLRLRWAGSAPNAARCAPDIAAGILLLASTVARVDFMHVVLYHFVLWTLLPIPAMRRRAVGGGIARYGAASLVLLIGALALSPLGPAPLASGAVLYTTVFFIQSYAHITLSFATSDAHPQWIVRLFRDSRPQAT